MKKQKTILKNKQKHTAKTTKNKKHNTQKEQTHKTTKNNASKNAKKHKKRTKHKKRKKRNTTLNYNTERTPSGEKQPYQAHRIVNYRTCAFPEHRHRGPPVHGLL